MFYFPGDAIRAREGCPIFPFPSLEMSKTCTKMNPLPHLAFGHEAEHSRPLCPPQSLLTPVGHLVI